jgi:Fe2+ or Zn2+ uptake regulation protein
MSKTAKVLEIEPYIHKLKITGMRVTEQRKAILSLLLVAKKPITVLEAHETLNKNKKKKVADLASLYRIFEAFKGLEIIHKTSHNAYILCQHMSCETKYHVLLHCHSCNGFIEIHMPPESIEPFADFFIKNKKFQIDKHPLGLSGLCANCQ